jgi:uncharacterized protein (TIGR04141 family)
MGNLNLYKIDKTKQSLLICELDKNYSFIGSQNISQKISSNNIVFTLDLYILNSKKKNLVNWNWLSVEFNNGDINTPVAPKAVLIIKDKNTSYAVTFGHSYFLVDKYCDESFAFTFARKIQYKEIKTTTLTNPNSLRNKTVSTYINYNHFEFDSGESYAKLKVNADLPDGFSIFKPSLEIGRSIRFSVENDSLRSIIDIIIYIDDVISNNKDIYKIPVFSKIKNIELLALLNKQMSDDVKKTRRKLIFQSLILLAQQKYLIITMVNSSLNMINVKRMYQCLVIMR